MRNEKEIKFFEVMWDKSKKDLDLEELDILTGVLRAIWRSNHPLETILRKRENKGGKQ